MELHEMIEVAKKRRDCKTKQTVECFELDCNKCEFNYSQKEWDGMAQELPELLMELQKSIQVIDNKKGNILISYRLPDATDFAEAVDTELIIQAEIAKVMHSLVDKGSISHFSIADNAIIENLKDGK